MVKARALILILLFILSCNSEQEKDGRPIEVLRQYMIAFKRGDVETMKALLSKESIKMAQQEAQARDVSLDEVIKEEKLFSKDQTKVEYKNERIEGDQAQVEIKTPYGSWEKVFFVKEDGKWRIAEEKFVEENLRKTQESLKELDRQIQEYFPDLQETPSLKETPSSQRKPSSQ